MTFTGEELLRLLPQRDPIVMIDGFDGEASRGGLTVAEDNIFCRDGEMDECGVIEHQAQTAAARAGYLALCSGGETKIGYIASVRGFRLGRSPRVGERIETEIEVEQEIFGITLLRAVSRCGGKVVAECRMKIYIKE